MADRPAYSFDPGPPPEVIRFFRGKGVRDSFDFDEIEPEEHAVSFAAAKATKADVLLDIRAAVEAAIAEGQTLETFSANLTPILQAKGWWGKTLMEDPLTGEDRFAQLGSPRRLRTIYNANLRSARAAGQWERIERTKKLLPYLEYRLGPSERHRPAHEAKAGMILHVDDPFWDEWMPPNGWGCKCWVRQITRAEAERRGISPSPKVPDTVWENSRTGQVQIVPAGIDPGWHRNPGKLRLQGVEAVLGDKIDLLPPDAQTAALRDMATSWRVKRILSDGAPGQVPIAALDTDIAARLGAETRLINISAATAEKQTLHHSELAPEDYARLVDLLATGRAVAQSETHLAFVGRDADLPWIAVVKRTLDRREVFLVSLYKSASARYVDRLIRRGEIWRD